MPDWQAISLQVQDTTGIILHTDSNRPVSGGCINSTYALSGQQNGGVRQFFIKTNTANGLPMFEAETEGLKAIIQSHSLRAPAPIISGIAGQDAYLLMEYVTLHSSGNSAQLGSQLARMHQTQHRQFGWHRDNTIGSTPQSNRWTNDWVIFWSERRLGTQLKLAAENGAGRVLLQCGETLQVLLTHFFSDYQPVPSLLHGDLWSGNYAFDERGQPVIFDPATYYGDRETDLAMTELFGGFPPNFYAAYNDAWPLDAGYATRKTLYNLYHILNHFNLFGGDYRSQAQNMIDSLLSECR